MGLMDTFDLDLKSVNDAQSYTPLGLSVMDLESAQDALSEAACDMESITVAANLAGENIEMEGMEVVTDAIKKVIEKIKEVLAKIRKYIGDFITGILNKYDSKWVEKRKDAIANGSKCKTTITAHNWLENDKIDEYTKKVEAVCNLVPKVADELSDVANIKEEQPEAAKEEEVKKATSRVIGFIKGILGSFTKVSGSGDLGDVRKQLKVANSDLNKANYVEHLDKLLMADGEAKPRPAGTFASPKYMDLFTNTRKEIAALKNLQKTIEKAEKSLTISNFDHLKDKKTAYKAVTDLISANRSAVMACSSQTKRLISLIGTRKRELKSAFAAIAADDKKNKKDDKKKK
jgi:hypothetical protein